MKLILIIFFEFTNSSLSSFSLNIKHFFLWKKASSWTPPESVITNFELINNFVKSIIDDLDLNQLIELNNLVNLGDEEFIKISNEKFIKNENKVIFLLKEFKKRY